MKYILNDDMDYIKTDDESMVVFDAITGNTHFINEAGFDILASLPCSFEELLSKMCKLYSVDIELIRSDIEEFLFDSMAIGMVLAYED